MPKSHDFSGELGTRLASHLASDGEVKPSILILTLAVLFGISADPLSAQSCLEHPPKTKETVFSLVAQATRSGDSLVASNCGGDPEIDCQNNVPAGSVFAITQRGLTISGDAGTGFSFTSLMEVTTPTAVPFTSFGSSCAFRIDTPLGASDTIQLSGDVVFTSPLIDGTRTNLVSIQDLSVTGLESSDVSVEGGFNCSFGTFGIGVFVEALRSTFESRANQPSSDQMCYHCRPAFMFCGAPRGGFNADGKNDLIWRDYASGAVTIWFLDGTTYTGAANLLTVADPNWRLEGSGDFDHNGSADLVWRNYATGAVNIWYFNGTSYIGGANLFTVADANWEIESIADFNRDSHVDLVWRNYATGAVNIWYLSGVNYISGANLFTVASPDWRLEGSGDFDGDYDPDLVWRNYATGDVNVWFLRKGVFTHGTTLFNVADPNMKIEAIEDYNGDAKADLVWRDYGTGDVQVWKMDGTRLTCASTVFNVPGASLQIAGPR